MLPTATLILTTFCSKAGTFSLKCQRGILIYGRPFTVELTWVETLTPTTAPKGVSPISTEENKAHVRQYLEEAWNKGNVGIIDALMTSDYARYVSGPTQPLNREGQKQRITTFRKALPDLHLTIDDLIAEGDKVVFRVTVRGTHQGAFMGISPTGKPVTV